MALADPRLTVDDYLRSLGKKQQGGLIFGYPRRTHVPARVDPEGVIASRMSTLLAHCAFSPIWIHDFADRPVVLTSPIDAVLDPVRALVLHPSAAVLLPDRHQLLRGDHQIWGAPSVVIEVISSANARHTRCAKLRWYAMYGVEECWLIDARSRKVEVLAFREPGGTVPRPYKDDERIVSRALGTCTLTAFDVFSDVQPPSGHKQASVHPYA